MSQLLLATPVRAAELATAQVSLGYSDFRVKLALIMPETMWSVSFGLDVVRARNRIVGELLSDPKFASVTHVLWVDDDQWPGDPRIVPEMMKLDVALLGAPYTNKKQPLRWIHRPDGYLGFGFTMTSRKLLEALAEQADWYTDLPNALRCPNLFGQLVEYQNGVATLLSEDFSFCKRARDAGFPINLLSGDVGINHAGGHVWNAKEMAEMVSISTTTRGGR